MARVCPKCQTVEYNRSVFSCRKCNTALPLEDTVLEQHGNVENTVLKEKWYIRCPCCETWIGFEDRKNIPMACPVCLDTKINNMGEDSILSEEEYLVETGEITEPIMEPTDPIKEPAEIDPPVKAEVNKPEEVVKPEPIMMKPLAAGKPAGSQAEITGVELINKDDGKVIRIKPGEYMLGRKGNIESDYFSGKRFIGREHAMIYVNESGFFIQDWDSTNRTRINGEFIYKSQGKMRVLDSDVITMADQNFEVRICR